MRSDAELATYGLAPLSEELAEELAYAGRGIPLHARDGTVRAYAMVDAQDFGWASRFHWSVSHGYVRRNAGGVWRYLHRELMGLPHGKGGRLEIDHRNRNRLDNRRSNLRVVTRAQNRQNTSGKLHGASSEYRGVSWDKSRGKWRAQGKVDGHQNFIGRYGTEEQAAEAASAWREAHMPYSIEKGVGDA